MQNVKPQLCDYVVSSYRHGFYCDLHIYCGETLGVQPLRCHQLVLSSISKYMAKILSGIPVEPTAVVSIHLPEFDVR